MASICEITTTSTRIRSFLATAPTTVARAEWHVMVGGMSAGGFCSREDAEQACSVISEVERTHGADAALAYLDACASEPTDAEIEAAGGYGD